MSVVQPIVILGLLVASATLVAFTYRAQEPLLWQVMCRKHAGMLLGALVLTSAAAIGLIMFRLPFRDGVFAEVAAAACFAVAAGLAVIGWMRVPAEVRDDMSVFVSRIAAPSATAITGIVLTAYLMKPELWV